MDKIVKIDSLEQLDLQLNNWLNPLNNDEEGPTIQVPLYIIQHLIWKKNDSFYLELLKNKREELDKQIKNLENKNEISIG